MRGKLEEVVSSFTGTVSWKAIQTGPLACPIALRHADLSSYYLVELARPEYKSYMPHSSKGTTNFLPHHLDHAVLS